MEASSIPTLFYRSHRPVPSARLRRCSDDQLVERFRAGREEAFSVIHDRYRVRLLTYVRQMLPARSKEDAEDVLQEVFERAARTLRSERPPLGLRAWLYSVAHNRCIDELRRRPVAAPDLLAASRLPASDTTVVAERRADVARLFGDLGGLPELQRSALLMRELQGLTHAEVAAALGTSVSAVKSLLVRARVGLTAAEQARGTACSAIRNDLAATHDRRVKASAMAARHLRECTECRSYRAELRRTSRRLGALVPVPAFFPLAAIGRLLGGAGVQAKGPIVASGLFGGGGAGLAGAGKLFAVLGAATAVTTGAVLEHDGALPWSTPGGVHRTTPAVTGHPGPSLVTGGRAPAVDPRHPTSASGLSSARPAGGGAVRPVRLISSHGKLRSPAIPGAAGATPPAGSPSVPAAASQPALPAGASAGTVAPAVGASPAAQPAGDPVAKPPAAQQTASGATESGRAGTPAPSGSPVVAAVVPVVAAAPKKIGQGADAAVPGGAPAQTSDALVPVVNKLTAVLN